MKTNHILYNPLSRNGKNTKSVQKLMKKITQKGEAVVLHNLLEIANVGDFIKEIEESARFIIVGGDGTLNQLVNAIKGYDVKQELFLYRAGTGNDFIRSIPGRGKLRNVKGYFGNLPQVKYSDTSRMFLNSAGIGVDALICEYVNKSTKKKTKWNYFRSTFRALVDAKTFEMTLDLDGVLIDEPRAWLAVIMNAQYLGGGMKAAPKQRRESDKLTVLYARNLRKWQVVLIFPFIYFGWHGIFKKNVKLVSASKIAVTSDRHLSMQVDGEVIENIDNIIIVKEKA